MTKKCRCGATYTPETWSQLPLVGHQDDVGGSLELRNCTCGSTISGPVCDHEACAGCDCPCHEAKSGRLN